MIFVVGGPLRRLVGFKPRVQIEAETVKEGLSALCTQYPDLRTVLFDASGQLRTVHRFALNRTILCHGDLGKRVDIGDELEVVTVLAGG